MRSHDIIYRSKLPNYKGVRIPVNSNINIEFIRENFNNYFDEEIVQYLEFGWPIGVTGEPPNKTRVQNHAGARNFPEFIDSYIIKEIQHKAILGPYEENPFESNIFISPLNSVPKDGNSRRIIVDLSFPESESVNSRIPKETYLDDPVVLKYPNVDSLVQIVRSVGKGALMFKRDLKRAYRQIPVDTRDSHLLGFVWRGKLYFDRMMAMGLRSVAQICQRITNAISFMFKERSGFTCVNYLDDFAGAGDANSAGPAFEYLGILLAHCGFEESRKKPPHPAPTTRMVFLGVIIDSVKSTLEVSEERLRELESLLSQWLTKSYASKKEVQSLIGKLNFVATCVRPSRVFLSRMLNFLRQMEHDKCPISSEFQKDVFWWLTFLRVYNGVSMIPWQEWSLPDEVCAVDACLVGCGGTFDNYFFHSGFPEFIREQNLHINCLELLTCIIAIKLWEKYWGGQRIQINCDNRASVECINSGKARHLCRPVLGKCVS